MKPWILIVGGIVLALLLVFWMFLFFAGDATKAELFNALNFGDTTGEDLGFGDFFDNENETDDSLAALRQLSLRRTIGYRPFEATASSSALVYMAEAGTGHIYSIDPATGFEERISNVTIPTAAKAVFSQNKAFAVVDSVDNNGNLTIISLPTGSSTLESYTIAADVLSFTLIGNKTLLYAEQNNSSVSAYSYDVEKKIRTALFTLPFREANIVWGTDAAATHLVYPKPSSQLEGYIYQVKKGSLSRLPISGYGLSAISDGEDVLFSRRAGDVYQTSLYSTASNNTSQFAETTFPEKCAARSNYILCGVSIQSYSTASPDNWYSGEVTYSDSLWLFDKRSGLSSFLIDLESESGRQLDVINLQTLDISSSAFFVNKIDQSLWIYEGDFMSNSGDN